MPFDAETGEPSRLARRQRYASRLTSRLSARSGSTADARLIIESPSTRMKTMVQGVLRSASLVMAMVAAGCSRRYRQRCRPGGGHRVYDIGAHQRCRKYRSSCRNCSTVSMHICRQSPALAPDQGCIMIQAERVTERLAERRPGFSLPQDFYVDPAFFEADLEAVFGTDWLFACNACEIRRPGDYLTLDIGH